MKFPRQSRLLRRVEFKLIFQQPIRSGDDCFRVLARVNGAQSHRLGMAVSKKVCAKAVGRNRIKRIVRENFRTHMAGKISDKALDFVVMPTTTTKNQNNKALNESLSAHWQILIRKAEEPKTGNRFDQSRTQQ